MIGDEYCLITS